MTPATTTGDQPVPTKAENLTFLTTNCSCLKGKEAALNHLDDSAIQGIADYVESLADHAELAQNVRNALKADSSLSPGELSGLVVNGLKPKKAGCEDDDDVPTKPTMNQWIAMMPEEAKATWNAAVKQHDKEKAALVERLVANAQGDKKAVKAKLEAKTLDQLQEMAQFIPPAATANARHTDYSGAAGGGYVPTENVDADGPGGDPLPVIRHDYTENAIKMS